MWVYRRPTAYWRRRRLFIAPAALSFSGTHDVTLGDDTSTATGDLQFAGTHDVTLADDTSTAAGALAFSGALDLTLADDASTTAGALAFIGTHDVTLADDTLAGAGSIINPIVGTMDVTLGGDASTAAGQLVFAGTHDVTLGDDTSTGVGVFGDDVTGTLDLSLGDDTSTASGTLTINPTGTLDVTLQDDTLAASGTGGEESPRFGRARRYPYDREKWERWWRKKREADRPPVIEDIPETVELAQLAAVSRVPLESIADRLDREIAALTRAQDDLRAYDLIAAADRRLMDEHLLLLLLEAA